jgi:ABC-type Zn2+ transport system substrate-binding protein/surface adhesin
VAVEEEVENMNRIQKENSKFDSYIQEALERVRGEISHMGEYPFTILHAPFIYLQK